MKTHLNKAGEGEWEWEGKRMYPYWPSQLKANLKASKWYGGGKAEQHKPLPKQKNKPTKQPNNQTTKQTNTCAAGCCLEAHLDGSGQKLCKVRLEPQGMPVDHNGVLVNAEQPLQRSESAGAGTGTAICKTQTQGHKATAHACITTTTTPSQRRAHLVELQESFKTV